MAPDLAAALDDLAAFHRHQRWTGALDTLQREVGPALAGACAADLIAALWHHHHQKGWAIRVTDHAQRAATRRLLALSPGLARLLSMAGATVVGRKLREGDQAEVADVIASQLGATRPPSRRR
jgi:hypothetical protein